MHLNLTADEVLTTTRAVRRRLDFDKPVEPDVIRDCVKMAMQGPTGGTTQGWRFVAVFDADKRAALAELYRTGWAIYKKSPGSVFDLRDKSAPGPSRQQFVRVARSADYLAEHLERVPVHVIPCITGRAEGMAASSAALASGSAKLCPAAARRGWNKAAGRAM